MFYKICGVFWLTLARSVKHNITKFVVEEE